VRIDRVRARIAGPLIQDPKNRTEPALDPIGPVDTRVGANKVLGSPSAPATGYPSSETWDRASER
jgi:hypothetical protein